MTKVACEILYDVVVWAWCMPVLLYAGVTHGNTNASVVVAVYISMFMHITKLLTGYMDIEHPCPCYAHAICLTCAIVLMTIGLPSAEKYGQLGPVGAYMAAGNSFFLSMHLDENKIEL